MLSVLQAFLIEAAKETGEKEVVVSDRFPAPFKIRALDIDEWERIQRLSTNPEAAGANRVSEMGVLKRCVIAGCVEPNFRDAEFLKVLGVQSADEAIKKTLRAGEIVTLANEITKFSGYGESVEQARKEAVN